MNSGRGIERLALDEPHDHVEGVHRLVVGQDVSGVAHHDLPELAHLARVPRDLSPHFPDAPRSRRVLLRALPLQLVDKVLRRRVGDDHVQLAVVNQDLDDEGESEVESKARLPVPVKCNRKRGLDLIEPVARGGRICLRKLFPPLQQWVEKNLRPSRVKPLAYCFSCTAIDRHVLPSFQEHCHNEIPIMAVFLLAGKLIRLRLTDSGQTFGEGLLAILGNSDIFTTFPFTL